jgi:mRNA interferase RelE/StbE
MGIGIGWRLNVKRDFSGETVLNTKKSGKKCNFVFVLLYHPHVKSKDLPQLGRAVSLRIEKVIRERLAVDPELFGLPLRRGMRGYRKLRVGDFRIIYRVVGDQIRILAIGHRSDIYSTAPKRVR